MITNSSQSIQIAVTACCLLSCLECTSGAFAQETIAWRTGNDFKRQLQSSVSLTWRDNPLRNGLDSLAESQRVAIFLDRRVDPSQVVNATIDDLPLEKALRYLAKQRRLGVGFVGPVVYVGPPRVASRVATLAELRNEEARNLPDKLRRVLMKRAPVAWPLGQPRTVVTSLAHEAGLELPAPERIPHDLWRETQLPPMTFSERLTLILAGFQMNFSIDADESKIHLTQFPRAVSIVRRYPVKTENIDELMTQLSRGFPQATIERMGRKLVVRSTLEDHWQLQKMLGTGSRDKSGSRNSPGGSRQVYTLNVQNQPVGTLLRTLAARLNLSIKFTTEAEALGQKLVTFSVRDANADELLTAAARPAGLKCAIVRGTIHVTKTD